MNPTVPLGSFTDFFVSNHKPRKGTENELENLNSHDLWYVSNHKPRKGTET